MVGPSNYEKWFYWQSSTAEQTKRNNIKYELENLLHSNPVIKSDYSHTTIHILKFTYNYCF